MMTYFDLLFYFYSCMAPGNKGSAKEVEELVILQRLEIILLNFFPDDLLFYQFWLFLIITMLVLL